MKINGNVKCWLLTTAGIASLGLGILGMVLPVLPTTPFLLLSAYCFARSSPRLLHWMTTNRLFGKYLSDYREKRGVPVKIKVYTLVMLWTTISLSAVFATDKLWLRIMLFTIAAAVTVHVLKLKTLKHQ